MLVKLHLQIYFLTTTVVHTKQTKYNNGCIFRLSKPPSGHYSSSSSSVGATTLGGFWPALRFCSTIFYLYTSLFFRSSSTWSSHLSLGLPTALDEHGFHSVSFLTVLVVSIRFTCATQHNLCDFINLTIFFS